MKWLICINAVLIGKPWVLQCQVCGPLDDIHPIPQDQPEPTLSKKPTWEGRHPPFGEWTAEAIRSFIMAPEVARLSPFCELKVRVEDEVGDTLLALKRLKEAAPGRVLVSIDSPPSRSQYFKR